MINVIYLNAAPHEHFHFFFFSLNIFLNFCLSFSFAISFIYRFISRHFADTIDVTYKFLNLYCHTWFSYTIVANGDNGLATEENNQEYQRKCKMTQFLFSILIDSILNFLGACYSGKLQFYYELLLFILLFKFDIYLF